MKLMGILNLTPDSFYDGGKYNKLDSAIRIAEKMAEEGVDYFDVGGESTRPGSKPVSLDEELKRVIPVVKKLVRKYPKIPVSVDSQKSEVAYQSLKEGARIINDISSLNSDPKMIQVIQEFKPYLILMHMQKNPQIMQKNPRYKNVVQEIKNYLSERIQWVVRNGIPKKKIWIDPGIGFGKTLQHNLEILTHLKDFLSLNCPVLVGHSRKSFIGQILNKKNPLPPSERLEGSLAVACWSFLQGVSILRIHDVGATRKSLQIFQSIIECKTI